MHNNDRHISDIPLGSVHGSALLCSSRSGGFLQIKLELLGGATDSVITGGFTQMICILFYCQIMMTILANAAKKLQTTALSLVYMRMCCF